MSPQYSLFFNEEKPHSKWNEAWSCEYHFKNTLNMLEITIGGDQHQGVVHYIEWIGFCEGGHPANPYRVDPHIALATLTGLVTSETVSQAAAIFNHQIEAIRVELKELNGHPDALLWAQKKVEELESLERKREASLTTLRERIQSI